MNLNLNENLFEKFKELVQKTEEDENDYTNPDVDTVAVKTRIVEATKESFEAQLFMFNQLIGAKEDDLEEQMHLGNITEAEAENMLEEYAIAARNQNKLLN